MAKFLRLRQQANQFGLRIRRCLGAGKVAGDKILRQSRRRLRLGADSGASVQGQQSDA